MIAELIRARHAAGVSSLQLAREFGLLRSTILTVLYQPGDHRRVTGEAHRARVEAGLAAGEPVADIARAIGWHPDNMPGLLKRLAMAADKGVAA